MAKERVSDLGEFGLIGRLRAETSVSARVVEGIGDDAAVLEGPEAGRLLLFACDTIAEGVHFLAGDPPERIGHKALACNLSDIAAMGGVPRAATLSLGCPPETPVETVDGIWAGMRALAGEFGVDLVGGDTHRLPSGLVLSVAIVGEVERELCVYRRGARPGDFLVVTGALGGSSAGRHLSFTPRVREGRWLAEHKLASAMIDLSDGLASDLHRLCEASDAGAEIQATRVPISDEAHALAARPDAGRTALARALFDGEDFELLVAVPPDLLDEAATDFHAAFGQRLHVLGRVMAERDIILIHDDGTAEKLSAGGFDHFG
jgi:thiamine-monophosphate kinase